MKKYSYPAVFTPEENGAYSISFPDFESCYTCGDSLADGIMMAEDVLAFTLYDYEKENRPVPS
ncbi:MAG: type II toxin-antitoxin system HicB family antitoxin, partial [Peptococcaceae bacterium]|nr:type II toxin-antitoxin system HicB family antitoxin [Peptococcaceae bacterium]MBO5140153.1 type II toxin-antitoxin system HicB family antitoxin [Peptococcaceae bacterium]